MKMEEEEELVVSFLILISAGIVGIVIWMMWGVLAGIVGVIMSLFIFSFAFEKAKPSETQKKLSETEIIERVMDALRKQELRKIGISEDLDIAKKTFEKAKPAGILDKLLRKGRRKKSEKLKKGDVIEILKGANIEFEELTKQDTFKILKSGNVDILVGKGNKPVITNIKYLIEAFKDPDAEIQKGAMKVLTRMGGSAVSSLVEAMEDEKCMQGAIEILVWIGKPAVPHLMSAIFDTNTGVVTKILIGDILALIERKHKPKEDTSTISLTMSNVL